MSEYFEKLQKLVELLGDEEEREQYLFNPLEEFHANENAHTRVLVALLKIPFVCQSFLQYLRKIFPSADEWFNGCEAEPTKVSCFSDYVDATITVGRKTAIIENKINDAEDQDAQIDRYVASKALASSGKDILVFYLTLDGSKTVSESSFSASRSILEYKSLESPGRFLAINYKDHVRDWLKNRFLFSISTFSMQPVLYSGVVQYIDYIEGEQCLALRAASDGCKKACEKIRTHLESDNLDYAVSLLSEYERRKSLFRAEVLDFAKSGHADSEWDTYLENEKKWALKTAFCEVFGLAKPDDDIYVQIPQANNYPNATIALNRWVDTSLVQVDFWFDGNGDRKEYEAQHDEYLRKIKEAACLQYIQYKYNNEPCVRCAINNFRELNSVLNAIDVPLPPSKPITPNQSFPKGESIQKWFLMEKPLARVVQGLAHEIDSGKWTKWRAVDVWEGFIVDYSYNYVNGWAIQLSENFSSEMPIRAIEFFPARRLDVSRVVRKLAEERSEYPFRNYRWDGRTVFQFPVDTKEYAKLVCSFLYDLRNDLTV